MSSKMEQIIEEIEEYIDGCKFQPLSSTKIIVNKTIPKVKNKAWMKLESAVNILTKFFKPTNVVESLIPFQSVNEKPKPISIGTKTTKTKLIKAGNKNSQNFKPLLFI